MTGVLDAAWLGRCDYEETSRLQVELVERRRAGEIGDLLLMLEHPPTYTLGRRTRPGDLPHDADYYRERGTAVCDTPRGGQVTWHGPGQLVIYPIIDLRGVGEQPEGAGRVDVAGFVENLEEAMIKAVSAYLPSPEPSGSLFVLDGNKKGPRKVEGLTGIWLGDAKVGSIGLRISRGITSHGISLNVSCDLEPFNSVTACGIDGGRATSILEVAGEAPTVREAGEAVASALAGLLDRRLNPVEAASTGIESAGIATA